MNQVCARVYRHTQTMSTKNKSKARHPFDWNLFAITITLVGAKGARSFLHT